MFVVESVRKILLFFIIFIISDFNQADAVNPSEEPLRSQILRGMELTINNNFQAASNYYQNLIEIYPNHPIGYFYKGANIQAQMLDAEDYSLSEVFYSLMDKAIKLSDSLIKQGTEEPWIYFYEGSAYLYKSFMKSKEGHWFSAYRSAKKGVHYLEHSVEIDSLFFDAYLGIGSYKYWKSAKSSFLRWTPFIKDEREEGIKLILAALNNGIFTQLVARDQLCWIFIDKGDCEKAFNYAFENYRQYPDSRFIKWTLASASFYFEKYEIIILPVSMNFLEENASAEERLKFLKMLNRKGKEVKGDYLITGSFITEENNVIINTQIFDIERQEIMYVDDAENKISAIMLELIEELSENINDELEYARELREEERRRAT